MGFGFLQGAQFRGLKNPRDKRWGQTIEGLEHPLLTFEESLSTSVLMGVCGKREVITGM